jgi:hypothetical protein
MVYPIEVGARRRWADSTAIWPLVLPKVRHGGKRTLGPQNLHATKIRRALHEAQWPLLAGADGPLFAAGAKKQTLRLSGS